MLSKECPRCGKLFYGRLHSQFDRRKYCSRPCADTWRAYRSGLQATMAATRRRPQLKQPDDYRLIPLTRRAVSFVDIDDYDLASSLNWQIADSGYARRTINIDGHKKNQRLHRMIMERVLGRPLAAAEQVDHKNGNRLDNRRCNLRIANPSNNAINCRRKTTLYRGVSRNHKRFQAKICVDGTKFYIGTFDTTEEAAHMYDQWAIQLHGDFAVLNML